MRPKNFPLPNNVFVVPCCVISIAVLLLACATPQKQVREQTDKSDYILLPNPQSALGVGTLLWGSDPARPTYGFLPAEQSFSEGFMSALPCQDTAWQDKTKESHLALGVAASPGPQILETLKLATLSGKAGIQKDSLQFLKWGSLSECVIDLQSLSESLVRGWYNMPGRALRAEAISKVRLDYPEYQQRPGFVYRSLNALGMEYGLTKESAANLSVAVGQALYGKAEGNFKLKRVNETTVSVDVPMVVAYDIAHLKSVNPAMAFPAENMNPKALNTPFVFKWYLTQKKEHVEIVVDPLILREADRRLSAESTLPQQVVQHLNQTLQSSSPAKLAVFAEAKPKVMPGKKVGWRRLEEGSFFASSDLVRLRLLLNEPCHIYILAKDSHGQAAVLYPKVSGESLSMGESKQLGKGEFIFPETFINHEGMEFPRDKGGIESFVVIASKEKNDALLKALADFARAARQIGSEGRPVANRNLYFSDIMRLPSGFASSPSDPGSSATANLEPLFSGFKTATVITLNLNRLPAN